MSDTKNPLDPMNDDHAQENQADRTPTRRDFLKIAGAGVVAGAAALPAVLGAQKKPAAKTKIDKPTITCDGATQASLNLMVCAGATGLPAGFSIQWMTCDAFNNGTSVTDPDTGVTTVINLPGQWPASDSPALCKASFSGNANLSRYNLTAGQCVSVNVGEFLFDNGASTNCLNALDCGTCYVFRSFGHATNALSRSDFTANLECSTLDCLNLLCGDDPTCCTYTQGYWKTHGPIPTGNNVNEWAVTSLTLGNVSYTDLELQSIFDTPAGGNGLIALAHQLIAAKLNGAKGADTSAIDGCIASADALIGNLIVPPVGSGSLAPSATSALTACLTAYNEGATGPGHCN